MPIFGTLLRASLAALLCLWAGSAQIAQAAPTTHTAQATEWPAGPLIEAEALRARLGAAELLLLDASPTPVYAKQHIPGAQAADPYFMGLMRRDAAAMQARLQAWGLAPGHKVVIYDQGGAQTATWLYFELLQHGVPEDALYILNGGLARWQASSGTVDTAAAPARPRGSFQVRLRTDLRATLEEVLQASGEPGRQAVVEALEPNYHYGEARFFDRGGHVPHARMLPSGDIYNADKTFKSRAELQRMAQHLGLRADQPVHSYCGGGVAATVPYFALRHLLGFRQVKVFSGSQLEWVNDPRGLPLWTYGAPLLLREADWLASWSQPMLRYFGATRLNVIDVRSPAAFQLGHVPFALNLPAERFRHLLRDPAALAAELGPAGVQAQEEAVILSDGRLSEDAALAFVALEHLGHPRVSVLMEPMDEWALRGLPLTKEATAVVRGTGATPGAIVAADYPLRAAPARVVALDAPAQGNAPRVLISVGRQAPAVAGRLHLPVADLLTPEGRPRPAKDIWNRLAQAGVPRYAELVLHAEQGPGEAAIAYLVLRLMGFPDVKLGV